MTDITIKKQRYADKENLKKLMRYSKATFATQSEVNEKFYTKEQIDTMFEESSGGTGGGGTGDIGDNYYTKSQINRKFYTKSEVDNLLSNKANDSDVVHKSSDETIAGTKTFTSTIVGNVTGNASTATKATQDAAGNTITTTYATKAENNTKANDSEVVHKSGDETIAGTKTFNDSVHANDGIYINGYLVTIG